MTQRLPLGPFTPNYSIGDQLRAGLEMFLPTDAHLRANGRLSVSLTRAHDLTNVLASEWESRDELIDCLLCSCFIPFFSGVSIPKFRGSRYLDGGFTDNLPVVCRPAITVSPFRARVDVCPADRAANPIYLRVANEEVALTLDNVVRFVRALVPPPVEALDNIYSMGYRDAYKFIKTSVEKNRKLIRK